MTATHTPPQPVASPGTTPPAPPAPRAPAPHHMPHATADPDTATHWQTRTVAAAIIGIGAIAIWQPQLGGGVLWALPMLLLAIGVMVGVLQPRSREQAIVVLVAWLLWLPISGLLAGQPLGAMGPTELPRTVLTGLATILRGAGGPLALAGWLALAGSCWLAGASLAVRPGRGAAASAFVLLTLPFASAFAVSRTEDSAWYGGALLAAALLWATRGTLRGGLAATLTVAVIGTIIAALIGPTERRIPQRIQQLPTGGIGGIAQSNGGIGDNRDGWGAHPQDGGQQGQAAGAPGAAGTPQQTVQVKDDGAPGAFQRSLLNDRMDYQSHPQGGSQADAIDFKVRSPQPALWRMQTYEQWDGRGWIVGPTGVELPQPAARRLRTEVSVESLEDLRVISAGRVISVRGGGSAIQRADGEARRFAQAPPPGTTYVVASEHVSSELPQLATIPRPNPADYPLDTTVWPEMPATTPLAQRLAQLPRNVAESGWGEVFKTAQRLSEGETTELGVVRNVDAYLQDPANFSYSLQVSKVGPQPLVTFLTDTHVGYCQHFAGAAALLLRLAGIPTRVVGGYATGEQRGDQYLVRGTDAHAWIEVYFPGYGWVPFNPTPGAAVARVAPSVDPTAPPRVEQGTGTFSAKDLAIVVLLLGGLGALVYGIRRWRRSAGPRQPLTELLPRVIAGPTSPSVTLRALRPELARIGPATAALADDAERARFVPGAHRVHRRPRWTLWRALARDTNVVRATWLTIFGAPRVREGSESQVTAARSDGLLAEAASVAPPGGGRPPA